MIAILSNAGLGYTVAVVFSTVAVTVYGKGFDVADISGIFTSNSELIIDFFRERESGFVIPLYQRAYSWDTENIDQLMDDICQGVRCLLEDRNDIHFLGTIIKVTGIQKTLTILNISSLREPTALLTASNEFPLWRCLQLCSTKDCTLSARHSHHRMPLANYRM